MRLYRTSARQWAGTIADATKLAREKNGRFEPIAVPTDKQGLIVWLNLLEHEQIDRESQLAGLIPVAAPPPPAPPAPAPDLHRERLEREITIEEAIGEADYGRALTLAEHIHSRLMEHARAARPRD